MNQVRAYTTGKAAKMFGVAARTVSQWCDSGKLNHYRIPTGRKNSGIENEVGDRRILEEDLIAFAKERGLLPLLRGLITETLYVGENTDFGIGDHRTNSWVVAGNLLACNTYVNVVVDCSGNKAEAMELISLVTKAKGNRS